jgi:ethanolamine utilization microcompartment shell protein EutS
MKALTTHEFVILPYQKKIDLLRYLGLEEKCVTIPIKTILPSELTLIARYAQFTSQPFKPELITELFEGWELIGGIYTSSVQLDKINYKDKVYLLQFYWNSWQINYRAKGEKYITQCKDNYLPKTLDRFICHCQDAGIELQFKEVG